MHKILLTEARIYKIVGGMAPGPQLHRSVFRVPSDPPEGLPLSRPLITPSLAYSWVGGDKFEFRPGCHMILLRHRMKLELIMKFKKLINE